MSAAADRREDLEAAIRLAVTRNGKCTATGRCDGCESNIADALDFADAYALAKADEEARALRQSVAAHGYTGRQP